MMRATRAAWGAGTPPDREARRLAALPPTTKACVVLPTLNEAGNVCRLLPHIFEQEEKIASCELHVLVVDGQSPDGTAWEVRRLMARYPRLHLLTAAERGLGAAYVHGFRYALHELEPDLLFQMDADLQHDPGLLPLFVALATNGFNLVIGSRFAAGGQAPGLPFPRRSLSLLGNWMVRVVGGVPRIRDCTSGYRCIHASLLRQCDLTHLPGRGYSFLSVLLQELLQRGARPVELPITFGARDYGRSKLGLRDKLEFLANVLRFRFRRP